MDCGKFSLKHTIIRANKDDEQDVPENNNPGAVHGKKFGPGRQRESVHYSGAHTYAWAW